MRQLSEEADDRPRATLIRVRIFYGDQLNIKIDT